MNIPRHTNCRRRLLTILRVVCFIAPAALLSMDFHSAAQAQQPDNPRTTTESQKPSPSYPRGPQSGDKSAKQLLQLKDRLLQLSQSEQNETTKAEIAEIIEAIAVAGVRAQTEQLVEKKPGQVVQAQELKQLQEQLALYQKQLADREKQYATVLAEQRRPPLPPLDNGTLKVYRLTYANARDGALMIESLFGTQSLRVAVDDRSNSLLIYGKPDILTTLDALLSRLDEQASPNRSEKKSAGRPSPRSLMLRVFWLADSVPETVGQNPAEFLPKSVLEATHKLGLVAPRLVTQTVNSLATGNDDSVDFSSNVPALLMDQPMGMSCEGKLKWVADDRVRLDMAVHVGGQVDLRGSMATPLGHYMVLGTANSMVAEGDSMAGGMPDALGISGRPAMGPGGGLGPARPEFGRAGGPEGGAAPAPGTGGGIAGPGAEFGAPGGMTVAPQAKQKFATSRFAFVVQVIEGQSYGAEKSKGE